jgi:electron transfer flavoprotein alpha subunit
MSKKIWVLPEINPGNKEISKLSLGLLSEAKSIAEKVGGRVTVLLLSDSVSDCAATLSRYGASSCYFFRDPLLKNFSSETFVAAILPKLREESPWFFIMGDTPIGRELAPRLAGLLDTEVVTRCARIDLDEPELPKFYHSIFAGQLEQVIVFRNGGTMLVTMDPTVLNATPAIWKGEVETTIIEPKLSPESVRVRHLEFLPADSQTIDIADAQTIVAAGMGVIDSDLLPLVEELAGLIDGAIGATRPVVDEGKITKDRLIGQTGKVVSPDYYMALGISGASHHVGGIRESGKIVSVNRDARASIFDSSDVGTVVDLREILPKLIERIKTARKNGEIV